KQMESIAEFCEQNSFFSDAERIRQRAARPQLSLDQLSDLPEKVTPPLPRGLDPIQQQWRVKLLATEKDYANQLYRLARQAMEDRHSSLAYALTRQVVHFDPDHRFARQLLGFVQDDNRWTTPFARRMRLKGFVDHPEFGWME